MGLEPRFLGGTPKVWSEKLNDTEKSRRANAYHLKTITLAKQRPYLSCCLFYLHIYKNISSRERGVMGEGKSRKRQATKCRPHPEGRNSFPAPFPSLPLSRPAKASVCCQPLSTAAVHTELDDSGAWWEKPEPHSPLFLSV